MTINLQDKASVELTGAIGTSELELAFDGTPLSEEDYSINHELRTLTAASLTAADFVHGSVQYRVHAWEVRSGGALSQAWDRSGSLVTSGPRDDINTDVLFIAAPDGVNPEPTSAEGPPPPGTSKTILKVKVHKQGSMPGD